MFGNYQAKGGGPGARCEHCRFPATVCWRREYQERMDATYGNATETLENHNKLYHEARCDWVKVVQKFVAGAIVAGDGSPFDNHPIHLLYTQGGIPYPLVVIQLTFTAESMY